MGKMVALGLPSLLYFFFFLISNLLEAQAKVSGELYMRVGPLVISICTFAHVIGF